MRSRSNRSKASRPRKGEKGAVRVVYTEPGLGAMQSIPHPPQILPQIRHHQRLRFYASGIVANSITFANLLDALLIATSATQGYQLFDQVKLKSVECWLPTAAVGATVASTVTLAFPGNTSGDAGDGRVMADTSMSVEPAHVFARPQKLSAAAMWQSTASAMNAISVNTSAGGLIIDVEVAYRNTDSAPTTVTNALVAATTGQVYYRGLDGLPIASTLFVPQAINTR